MAQAIMTRTMTKRKTLAAPAAMMMYRRVEVSAEVVAPPSAMMMSCRVEVSPEVVAVYNMCKILLT